MTSPKISPARVLGLWCGLFLLTHAHMQMIWPYPIYSEYDPAVPVSEKDYSMTSPLLADGSNFPCKNYQLASDSYTDKAVYVPGQTYNITLGGSATHDGGSCQISLSYDNGVTFKVIESMIGGCPLTPSYDFTIPSFAPASDTVLLSWSWFNLVGNREMYQNCARVQITNPTAQRYQREKHRRQNSMDSLPNMFVCNVNNGCTTIEQEEVVFPDPGSNVIYGQDAVTPNPGPGFTESGNANNNPAVSTAAATPGMTTISSPASTSTVVATTLVTKSASTSIASSSNTSTLTQTTFVSSTRPMFMAAVPTMTSTMSPDDDEGNDGGEQPTSSVDIGPPYAPTASPPTTTPAASDSNDGDDDSTSSTNTDSPTSATTSLATPSTTSSSDSNDDNDDGSDSGSTPSSTTTQFTPPNTYPSGFTTSTLTNSFSAAPTAGSTSNSISAEPCTPGELMCNSLTTWSQCVTLDANGDNGYTYMGSVAAGTQCVNGQFQQENSGTCNPSGNIFCNGSNAFYMCVEGGLINMGPLAAGTVCQDNTIVAG